MQYLADGVLAFWTDFREDDSQDHALLIPANQIGFTSGFQKNRGHPRQEAVRGLLLDQGIGIYQH